METHELSSAISLSLVSLGAAASSSSSSTTGGADFANPAKVPSALCASRSKARALQPTIAARAAAELAEAAARGILARCSTSSVTSEARTPACLPASRSAGSCDVSPARMAASASGRATATPAAMAAMAARSSSSPRAEPDEGEAAACAGCASAAASGSASTSAASTGAGSLASLLRLARNFSSLCAREAGESASQSIPEPAGLSAAASEIRLDLRREAMEGAAAFSLLGEAAGATTSTSISVSAEDSSSTSAGSEGASALLGVRADLVARADGAASGATGSAALGLGMREVATDARRADGRRVAEVGTFSDAGSGSTTLRLLLLGESVSVSIATSAAMLASATGASGSLTGDAAGAAGTLLATCSSYMRRYSALGRVEGGSLTLCFTSHFFSSAIVDGAGIA
mmetsp:Transcript_4459/g.10761  ORF Transcript_4459/g.10761 Transcript_4459/m.10761 type:complete len:403 (-) Transcript_4459:63-1271(-)